MASNRRLVADLNGIGKLLQHKKTGAYFLMVKLGQKKRPKSWRWFKLRWLHTDMLQIVISDWLAPAYAALINGEPDPWSNMLFDQEHIRISLDLCYRELARRADLIHK